MNRLTKTSAKLTKWIWGLVEPDDFERIGNPIRVTRRATSRLKGRHITRQLTKQGNPPW